MSKEKKQLLALINGQWGADFKAKDLAFLRSEKDRIYTVHKDVSRIDLSLYRINTAGMYFAEHKHGDFRLSIEGSQIVGPLANKNVVELSDAEVLCWLRGADLDKAGEWSGFVIIKNKSDFLGCGKCTADGRILNFVSKARRLNVADLP